MPIPSDRIPSEHLRGRKLHITFICTGNICRSPMAEKIFAQHIERAGLNHSVRVTSAGTGGWHIGDGADERTVAQLREHGYPSEHEAAEVDDDHLRADLLVALDTGHARELSRLGVPSERIELLRTFDPDADSESVADPYYEDDAAFAQVREQIEAAVPGLMDWTREQLTGANPPVDTE